MKFFNNLEEVLEEWAKDTIIDIEQIDLELAKNGLLHSKYLSARAAFALKSKRINTEYTFLRGAKYNYYEGKMSEEELKERGWTQFPLKLHTVSLIEKYCDKDKDLLDLLLKKAEYDVVVDTCESILKEVSQRGFHLNGITKFRAFEAGLNHL